MRIAHITDLHLDEDFLIENNIPARKQFETILEHINTNQIDHIICTGDIGEQSSLAYFFEKLRLYPLDLTLGNHDAFIPVSKHLKAITLVSTQKLYYSSIHGTYKFIFMDSSEGNVDKEQLLWLTNELQSSLTIIIFIHHPILRLQLKVDEIGGLKNYEALLSILEQHSKPITVFCGHYHMNNSSTYKNITQHITPATSYQIQKDKNQIEIDLTVFGYRIITISKAQITSTLQLFSHAD